MRIDDDRPPPLPLPLPFQNHRHVVLGNLRRGTGLSSPSSFNASSSCHCVNSQHAHYIHPSSYHVPSIFKKSAITFSFSKIRN